MLVGLSGQTLFVVSMLVRYYQINQSINISHLLSPDARFSAKMHQIQFQIKTPGSLQRSLKPCSWWGGAKNPTTTPLSAFRASIFILFGQNYLCPKNIRPIRYGHI